MTYFVTGGTGFIGRHLVAGLVRFGEPVHVLFRPGSRSRLDRLIADCGSDGRLIVPVEGDLGASMLGASETSRAALRDRIKHFFHLAALYDLDADAADLERANVVGTRNALALANELGAGCFHHMSSIAVAGRFPGTFSEEMFEEAVGLEQPYFRTKHDAEALVRRGCRVPWRIYRPGMVVGDSRTGEMDKIDGPYYLFKLIQKMRRAVPQWVPLLGFEGGGLRVEVIERRQVEEMFDPALQRRPCGLAHSQQAGAQIPFDRHDQAAIRAAVRDQSVQARARAWPKQDVHRLSATHQSGDQVATDETCASRDEIGH